MTYSPYASDIRFLFYLVFGLGYLCKFSPLKYDPKHFRIILVFSAVAEIVFAFVWDIHYFGIDAFILSCLAYYLICPDFSRRLDVYRNTYLLGDFTWSVVIISVFFSLERFDPDSKFKMFYSPEYRHYLEYAFAREGLILLVFLIFINYVIICSFEAIKHRGNVSIKLGNNFVFTARLSLVIVLLLNVIICFRFIMDYPYIEPLPDSCGHCLNLLDIGNHIAV